MALTKRKLIIIAAVAYYHWKKRFRPSISRREVWVSDLFLQRESHGTHHTLIPLLINGTRYHLRRFLRIDEETFLMIVNQLKPNLQKFSSFRKPLSPEKKLAVTLRFLATGESYESLQYQFRIAANTISGVVSETCDAIITILGPIYLKTPTTAEEWSKIADNFEQSWQFPNCIGAIDGKHISIKKTSKQWYGLLQLQRFLQHCLIASG